MDIRLVGSVDEVEAVTRELRRLFTVRRLRDYPARKKQEIRRYLQLETKGDIDSVKN